MRTALVVEDDEIPMRVFINILRHAGFHVLQAADLTQAIRACKNHDGPIDILVCDLKLALTTGTAVALEVVALRPGIPVLFTSGTPFPEGWTDIELAELARLPSKNDFLQKPFRAAELESKVADLLKTESSIPPGVAA